MDRFYQILEYNMTKEEALAFKLALIWEELTQSMFSRENCGKLPTKGDPRKSNLFRYCYKMARETRRIILPEQYRWFVKAQLDILKNIKQNDQHANVSPSCLVGEKAWRRWMVWQKKFNNISKINKEEIKACESKIIFKLNKTKEFLLNQFRRKPTLEDIQSAFDSRAMIRWITLGKISGYYVVLSPLVAKCLKNKDFEKEFNFDLTIYKNHITPEVEEFFSREFSWELNGEASRLK